MDSMARCESYTEYLMHRCVIRKMMRGFYLRSLTKSIRDKAIDFGCGIGSLLSLLPEGSIGFEINKFSVEYCKSKNLDVTLYVPDEDKYELKGLKKGCYKVLILNHVLEHMKQPNQTFRKILKSCNRLGVEKIIIVVPGEKGFRFDKTHDTFIYYDYLIKNGLIACEGYCMIKKSYFPLKFRSVGKIFTHNELRVVYGRKS